MIFVQKPSTSYRQNEAKSVTPYTPDDADLAAKLQIELNDEDRLLADEREKLSGLGQRIFMCGVCLDDCPEDDVARIDSCQHCLCRECLKGYIRVQLRDHRYPILCPICTADSALPESVPIGGE